METEAILKAMTAEEKIKLICPEGGASTTPIKALPSITVAADAAGLYEGAPRFFLTRANGYTRFPSPAAIGCSWDKNLAYNVGREIGRQCCARGLHLALGPNCLPFRQEEGVNYLKFSAQPLESGTLAAEFIRGVQSTGVGACLAVCGRRSLSGLNLTALDEAERLSSLDYALKAEPRAALAGGEVRAELLRQKGFEGVCVSEWGDGKERAALIKEGCDMAFCTDSGGRRRLETALNDGRLTTAELDEAALRVLKLIDYTYDDHPYDLDDKAQMDKSADFAAGCAVLLKNDGILPITGDSVTVVGCGAERLTVWGDEGGTTETASLIKELSVDRRVKVLAADASPDIEVRINEALEHTFPDETVIIVLSGTPDCTGAPSDALPEGDLKLIERLEESGRNVAAVVAACNFDYSRLSAAKAVLYAPYLGNGAAAALKKLICGELSPSGKLCAPLSCKTGGLPLGHGLSYSPFSYSDAIVRPRKDGGCAVTFTLKNEGRYHAAEAVQLYVCGGGIMKLAAFDKHWLRAGESRAVTLEADRLPRLADESDLKLAVCASASDVRLTLSPAALKSAGGESAADKTIELNSKNDIKERKSSGRQTLSSFKEGDLRTAESLNGLAGKIARRKIKKLSLKLADGDAERAGRLSAAALKTPLSRLPAQSNNALSKSFVQAVLLLSDGKPFAALKRALSKKD